MKTYFVSFLLSLCFFVGHSQSLPSRFVSGIVFIDINGNGIKDAYEKGIKGVAVSDQVHVTRTDNSGHYKIGDPEGKGFVYVSMPSGYASSKNFWQPIDLKIPTQQIDFPLLKTTEATSFKFIHASDTHISERSLDRMQKFRAKVDSIKPDFVLITGDLIRDALRVQEKEAAGYYQLFIGEAQKIKSPMWTVPGNHEIFGIERHLSLVSKDHPLYGRKMYHSFLGPDYFSFNYGGIHFIGLNSLEFEDLFYYGSIDPVQREWLKRDLAVLPSSTPVVTFQHVPFFSGGLSMETFEEEGLGRTLEREKGKLQFRHTVSNAHEIISILRANPYPLALAGHNHFRQLFFIETSGIQTRFEQTAAIVGPNEFGNLQMPSGFTVYQAKDGKIDEGVFVKIR
jgi:predicted MPP superfamily phosphohydrolase